MASSDAAPSPERKQLGEILAARRAQISPRYSKREAFIRDRGRGLSPSTFADVETRARTTFEPATIIALELIYMLPPGWLAAALNGDIRPLPPPGKPTPVQSLEALSNLTDADLPEEYLDELERIVIIGDFTPERRLAIWETMKTIREMRKDKHRADRPEQYG